MRGPDWFLEPNPNATAKSNFPTSPPIGIERKRERPWSVVAKLPAACDLLLNWLLRPVFSARGWLPLGLAFLLSGPAIGQETEKNVLIFRSFTAPSATPDLVESQLRASLPGRINFYVEDLEGRRFDDHAYETSVFETVRHTYAAQKLDLIMAQYPPALYFALKYRAETGRDLPIVFWEVDGRRLVGQKTWTGVTGVTNAVPIRGTIDLALHLHPETNTVAIISDQSSVDSYWLVATHAELLQHYSAIREIDLVGLTTSELVERVATLPAQSVVLFQKTPQQSVQPVIGAYDIMALVGQRFPIFSIWPELCLNHGCISGDDWDRQEQASWAAKLAARVLSGEPPESLPIVNASGHQVRVDALQLRHWNIPESALPPGTLVLNQQPTLWERGRKYFLAAITVIVVQALLIFGLFWQRARKRKAEAILSESEERFRVMADTTPSLIWMCDEQGKITYLNDRRVSFTGSDFRAGYADAWTAYVHPEDLKDVQDALAWALKSQKLFSKDYRLRRHDGVYRWMFDVASPRVGGDGRFAGFIGSAIDMTDQKLAQEALEKVGGRLLEAQEEERRRIARELHDDISQKLAILSMELAQANRSANEATKERLNHIRQHCIEIANDIQSLSHQLHYSKLDYLGLVGALKGFCREFAQQYDVSVEFKDENAPPKLPQNISLCLFRVTQEALHNAVKYSGTQEYTVRLSASTNELQLVVSDSGAGFDVAEAMKNQGLGLVSMQERVHLVQGRLSIESRPGEGTKIVAWVPVTAENDVSSAEGQGAKGATVPGAA
jgi:PAS domain S-box-containing protein